MTRIVIITGGGDWYDASVEAVAVPDGIDSDALLKEWEALGTLFERPRLAEWLKARGGQEPSAAEVTWVEDV